VPAPVCLALPGAGTALGVVAGACEFLAERFTFVAAGGTSGGGLVALALAAGMTSVQVSEMLIAMLTRTDLLDKGWPFDQSPGIFKGKVVEQIFKDVFGKKKMKELKMPARVCVVDLAAELPAVIDSVEHGDVPVWRAARGTMAIEGFFDPAVIHEDNPLRTVGDGGLVINCPAGLWDDKSAPTIAMRFAHQKTELSLESLIKQGWLKENHVKTVKTWEDLIPALVNTSMNTACITLPSKKAREQFGEVVLRSKGSGMKFGLTHVEAEQRRLSGRTSAAEAQLWHLETKG